MRDEEVTEAELRAARDFLIGVFPLRFETAGAVVAALSGLVVHDLGVDELINYRSSFEAVTVAGVAAAARAHLLLDEAAIVVVGDADAFGPALEAADVGPVAVERDEGPIASGPLEEAVGPVDGDDDTGPVTGARDPDLPGTADEPSAEADQESR